MLSGNSVHMNSYWHKAEHQNLAQHDIHILYDAKVVSLGEFSSQEK